METIDTDLHSLVINELTKAQYDELAAQGRINENELYIVTDAEDAELAQEIQDRQSADEQLQQNIDSVEKSLSDKATELSNTITTESTRLEGLVTAETEARTAKDTEIESKVQNLEDTKQDNLTAGTNMEINDDNVISTVATQVIRRKW